MGSSPASGILQIQELFQRILNISIGAAFIAVTIVLMYAGITFLVSAGEPAKTKVAKDSITWALLGILFLALAWLFLKLIEVFTGVPVTKFCLGFPGAPTLCP